MEQQTATEQDAGVRAAPGNGAPGEDGGNGSGGDPRGLQRAGSGGDARAAVAAKISAARALARRLSEEKQAAVTAARLAAERSMDEAELDRC